MTSLQRRGWVPEASEHSVQELADKASGSSASELSARIETLAEHGREIHERSCFNLNPAANVMAAALKRCSPQGLVHDRAWAGNLNLFSLKIGRKVHGHS